MVSRRNLLEGGAAALAATGSAAWLRKASAAQFELPAGVGGEQTMEALPGKVALVRKTYRPPNYETPIRYFGDELTRNDAFFVRYHLSGIPVSIDAAAWTLEIGGPAAGRSFSVTLANLKAMEKVEIVAVNQCSGNRRGFSDPHVAGVQWGAGAMGNARWGGVRLKDLLQRAELGPQAVEIAFSGAGGPVLETTPDFEKSLPVWKATDGNTLVAYEMNGEPLPHPNGAPARLVVPGWTGTYWMKHLTRVQALTEPLKNFWTATAYRIPSGMFPIRQRFTSQEVPNSTTTPITEMVINSTITNLESGAKLKSGRPVEVEGIAWDGGYGITGVELSTDGGKSWLPATFLRDLGRFAWRRWRFPLTPAAAGAMTIKVRARNAVGQTQVEELLFNGAGYHNNVVQALSVTVA